MTLYVADCMVFRIIRESNENKKKLLYIHSFQSVRERVSADKITQTATQKLIQNRTSLPLLAMFVVDSFKFSSDLFAGYIFYTLSTYAKHKME